MFHRRKQERGFTLAEIAIALCVFTLLTLACASAFPAAMKASHTGSSYAQAALTSQHKIDQCRQQGYTNVYAGGAVVTALSGLNIVDAGSGLQNPTGYPAGSVSYTFTGADNLAASNLPPGATGTLVIGPPSSGTRWTPSGQIVQVTVVIAWPSGQQGAGQFTTHTLLVNG